MKNPRHSVSVLFLCSLLGLSGCGGEQSSNSDLLARISENPGVRLREYIVEENDAIRNKIDGQYFPSMIPFGDSVFWYFGSSNPAVQPDPSRENVSGKLLNISVPAGDASFSGTFYHDEYARLGNLNGSPWSIEFRPLFRIGRMSGPGQIRISMTRLEVCSRINDDSTITTVNRLENTSYSDWASASNGQAQTRLEFADSITQASFLKFYNSCIQDNPANFIGSSVTLDLQKAGYTQPVDVQFIHLRILKDQDF